MNLATAVRICRKFGEYQPSAPYLTKLVSGIYLSDGEKVTKKEIIAEAKRILKDPEWREIRGA